MLQGLHGRKISHTYLSTLSHARGEPLHCQQAQEDSRASATVQQHYQRSRTTRFIKQVQGTNALPAPPPSPEEVSYHFYKNCV